MLIRRLLIIGVGSSANMHLIRRIAIKYPALLFNNELVMIETSADVLKVAIQKLYETYKQNYRYLPAEDKKEIPEPYTFKEKLLTRNGILLAKEGGAADPDRGLSYFNAKSDYVLEKISDIYFSNELSGIIVLGSAGKGTGTLITPTLIKLLNTSLNKEIIGFVTLPFRTHKTDITNAQKMIKYITGGYMVPSEVPLFLLDYESVFDIHLYQSRQSAKLGEAKIGNIYRLVIEPLALTISSLVEALNFGESCSPPMDWSDLSVLFEHAGVGTMLYSLHTKEEELVSRWKDDLDHQRFLNVSALPEQTNAVTIIKSGTGVPVRLIDDISEYFTRAYKVERHSIYILERGEGQYIITSLVSGLDARKILPPVEHKKYSFWQRLTGGGKR